MINARFGDDLCCHYTYVIAGDGCLMEGISEEAASLAGHLRLNRLIVFWDNNNITIDGTVDKSSSTDQLLRFQAMGWNTISIDGHDYIAIRQAIASTAVGQADTDSLQNDHRLWRAVQMRNVQMPRLPLGAEETAAMRNALGWKWKPFEIPAEILDNWRQTQRRSLPAYNRWVEKASAAGSEFRDFIANRLPRGWDTALNALKNRQSPKRQKLPRARLRKCV